MGKKGICILALIVCICGCSKEEPRDAAVGGDGAGGGAVVQADGVQSVGAAGGDHRSIVLEVAEGVSMKLVEVPAGRFVMGSQDDEAGRHVSEGPVREVTISKPFHMGIHEVTQGQYEAVMGGNPSRFRGGARPVESVSWDEATEFCRKVSARTGKVVTLPTEAQWEYACRAGSQTRYFFGDDEERLGDYARYGQGSDTGTDNVGAKKPNAWGLYDMHGNVWEWCLDWHAMTYAQAGSKDPTGLQSGQERVLRGGSWAGRPENVRSAVRSWHRPGHRDIIGGFRIVAPHAGDEVAAGRSADGSSRD